MKCLPKLICAVLLSAALCIPAALAVFFYTRPMTDVSYDLSMSGTGEAVSAAEDKGWTVYVDEKGKRKELTADGFGSYKGLEFRGQTFYYSRILTEELESPTLKLGVANRSVSVFLDDTVVYTDFPELDNRIGYLKLPMQDADRVEPVTVSLPSDCRGKTLTIAQSGPMASETQDDSVPDTVYPCSVTLYCGYAYESTLIASTAKTMLPAALFFALGLFLLAAFIWSASTGKLSLRLPVFALAAFFQMCSVLAQAEFFYQYFGVLKVDLSVLFFYLSIGALLLLLTLCAQKMRPLFLAGTLVHGTGCVLYLLNQTDRLFSYGDRYVQIMNLPRITGFFALLAALIGMYVSARQNVRFFRHMAQTSLALITGYVLFLAASIPLAPGYASQTAELFKGDFLLRQPHFSLQLLWGLCLFSTLAAVLADLVEREAERRTERSVLAAKGKLAVESYENLRSQSEEIAILRHDTLRHYSMLRTMLDGSPKQAAEYLDNLIGQAQKIRPVVSSGNQTLDIILNGKLNEASSRDIPAKIVRAEAPEKLPLADTDLCCLIMNILDNAIEAASASSNPYLRLDFHTKERHFVFSCENAAAPASTKKSSAPGHGYGVKIIRQIMNRWGENMVSVEQAGGMYRVTVVMPL